MFILLTTEQSSTLSCWEKIVNILSHDAFKNAIAALTLLLAIFAAYRALAQWKESKRIKRAEYLDTLTDKIRSTKEITEVMSMIEYDRFKYDKEFHDSELEEKVDKTLSYFSYICYLKKQNILSPEEFKCFDYEVTRIFHNEDIVNYLYNLYHFAQKFSLPVSFYYLVEFGLENDLLDKHFKELTASDAAEDKVSSNYNRVLEIDDPIPEVKVYIKDRSVGKVSLKMDAVSSIDAATDEDATRDQSVDEATEDNE